MEASNRKIASTTLYKYFSVKTFRSHCFRPAHYHRQVQQTICPRKLFEDGVSLIFLYPSLAVVKLHQVVTGEAKSG